MRQEFKLYIGEFVNDRMSGECRYLYFDNDWSVTEMYTGY